MHASRFLCGLPFSFNSVCVQLLGSKELPSLSEVFSRLRQASPSSASSVYATGDRLALVSSIGGSRSSSRGPSHFAGPKSFGRSGDSSGHNPKLA